MQPGGNIQMELYWQGEYRFLDEWGNHDVSSIELKIQNYPYEIVAGINQLLPSNQEQRLKITLTTEERGFPEKAVVDSLSIDIPRAKTMKASARAFLWYQTNYHEGRGRRADILVSLGKAMPHFENNGRYKIKVINNKGVQNDRRFPQSYGKEINFLNVSFENLNKNATSSLPETSSMQNQVSQSDFSQDHSGSKEEPCSFGEGFSGSNVDEEEFNSSEEIKKEPGNPETLPSLEEQKPVEESLKSGGAVPNNLNHKPSSSICTLF